jgi:Tfp pilus assembly PilM family ATPase
MPQLLALEWNGREIRAVVASGRGRQVLVEHAFSIPLEGTAEPTAAAIGARIAEQLDARALGRPETIVAVGRTSIELRQLQLPPAPDAELPDLVRFQAGREFNELDERWLLDFVPIDQAADGPRTVLATAIAPATLKQIQGVCEAAGLTMRRLVLRAFAAASLAARAGGATPGKLRLLIDLLADEADLTAVVDDKAVFLRTTRLAGDPPPLPAMLTEIRLTMAAVQNQAAGGRVESIVLCSSGRSRAELGERVAAELGIPVELFDPFAALELSPALRDAMPPQPSRFAPLLGAAAAEVAQSAPAIDFLHPRRAVAPPNPRRKWIAIGAAVVLLLIAYLVWGRIEHYQLAGEVDELESKLKTLETAKASAEKIHANVAEIAKWADDEVIWLDKLEGLSDGFPPADDALLGQLSFAIRQSGAQMDLKGWVRRANVIAKMEQNIRARGGQIGMKNSREDGTGKHYSWRFDASIQLSPPAGNTVPAHGRPALPREKTATPVGRIDNPSPGDSSMALGRIANPSYAVPGQEGQP